MSGPSWKKSEFVDLKFAGHKWRFRRLGARRMNAMKIRAINISRDSNLDTLVAICEAEEIEKMLADLAEGLSRIDGDPFEEAGGADELDRNLSDDQVLGLWCSYLNACSPTDDDKGKSDAPSSSRTPTAPSQQGNETTTVAGAVTESASRDVAGIH
jgi:hypothetical protein